MTNQQIKETLEKQLQLLSECSVEDGTARELVELSDAMVKVAGVLLSSE